jgi:hypothetical protein
MSRAAVVFGSLLWGLSASAPAVEPVMFERPESAVDLKDPQGRFLAWGIGPSTNYLQVFPPGTGESHPKSPLVLAVDGQSRNVATLEQWKGLRADIRKRVLAYVGNLPSDKLPLEPKVESETDKEDYTLRAVSVAFDKNVRRRLCLVIPKGLPAPAPAVIMFPGWGNGIERLTEGVYSSAHAIHLARHGFVVAALDNWYDKYGNSSELATLGATTHMASRAVDYLITQKDLVAPDQIGVFGHVYGGDLAVFAAALEERLAACATSCTQNIALPAEYHNPPWTGVGGGLGCVSRVEPAMYRSQRPVDLENLPFSTQELFALIAPRPLMNVATDAQLVECIRTAWRLYGRAGAVELVKDKWKENQAVITRDYMADFFLRALKGIRPGKCPEATVKEILDGLRSAEPARQLRSARLAAWWRCQQAAADLDKLLTSQDAALRRSSAKALERAGAMKELLPHLTHADPMVRLVVVEAMQTCGDKAAFDALAKHEDDKDKWVRECKAQTIQVRVRQ